MSYSAVKRRQEEAPMIEAGPVSRMCLAHGCPNVGTISDHGGPGAKWLCYHHFSASSDLWGRITAQIKADPSMGNWGFVPTRPSAWVVEARKRVKAHQGGMRAVTHEGGEQ